MATIQVGIFASTDYMNVEAAVAAGSWCACFDLGPDSEILIVALGTNAFLDKDHEADVVEGNFHLGFLVDAAAVDWDFAFELEDKTFLLESLLNSKIEAAGNDFVLDSELAALETYFPRDSRIEEVDLNSGFVLASALDSELRDFVLYTAFEAAAVGTDFEVVPQ